MKSASWRFSQGYPQPVDMISGFCHNHAMTSHRLKLRWPNGAELEAEGTPEFIRQERQEFLGQLAAPAGPGALQEPNVPHIDWEAITERRGQQLQLRGKPPGATEKEACLVLLAASQRLLGEPKPTAGQLAKWLRGSGFPIGRVDRALQSAVTAGEVLSSGSRRGRRYELTAHGRMRAYILANQLTGTITGRR